MNKYPAWKYLVIVLLIALGGFYAFPNLFGNDPGMQIRGSRGLSLESSVTKEVERILQEQNIPTTGVSFKGGTVEVRFTDTEQQLKARDVINAELGRNYTSALTLLPASPQWINDLGIRPMYLGLDLRGGVHFLLEVDMQSAVETSKSRAISDVKTQLRKVGVRYRKVEKQEDGSIQVVLRKADDLKKAIKRIENEVPELSYTPAEVLSDVLNFTFDAQQIKDLKTFALQQNMTSLRNRIDQLGVAEPVVQQQGDNRIVVQLPGVQDTARAKRILGRAATLEMRMVDEQRNSSAISSNVAPAGTRLYEMRDGRSILLKNDLIYSGDNIVDAQASIDSQNGSPIVSITLDGKGERANMEVTGDNVGNRMAVVYLEIITETQKDAEGRVLLDAEGQPRRISRKLEEVITAPVIRDQLGKRFQISGLDGIGEARDLSLMLRAGALAAPIEIIEERTVGPSLGKDNIKQGFISVLVGLGLVLLFMAFYYRVFGLVADIALVLNLVLMVAVLSFFQATLTLPGVAGIVLTVGMAVDANVLIFERIREELRNGNSPAASIEQGYGRAFWTIFDANVTTLIASAVLFAFGTGPIKGFAVTLSIGIITSMFTAIVVSRGLINLIYGGKKVDKLAI
ncbi:MAG: preprotein translocase subunit SecD [Saprospiraceae bacterium]|jgi:preprotein translocase subunit SecD